MKPLENNGAGKMLRRKIFVIYKILKILFLVQTLLIYLMRHLQLIYLLIIFLFIH